MKIVLHFVARAVAEGGGAGSVQINTEPRSDGRVLRTYCNRVNKDNLAYLNLTFDHNGINIIDTLAGVAFRSTPRIRRTA